MSKYFEYKHCIIKISHKVLSYAEMYSLEEQTIYKNHLCHLIHTYYEKHQPNFINKKPIEYRNNIYEFGKIPNDQLKDDFINESFLAIQSYLTGYNTDLEIIESDEP